MGKARAPDTTPAPGCTEVFACDQCGYGTSDWAELIWSEAKKLWVCVGCHPDLFPWKTSETWEQFCERTGGPY